MPLLFGDFFKFVLEFLLFSASGFIILLVLVQRGRGGGLTGALGGMGGQSAFGAKAGDVFTRITVGAAIIWILLCLLTIRTYTYVNVNTTAMKEYQYLKLINGSPFGEGEQGSGGDVRSSLNLGKNADDSPGARLDSLDSDADKKSGKKLEDSTNETAPGANESTPGAKDEGRVGNGKEAESKKEDTKKAEPNNEKAGELNSPENSKSTEEEKAPAKKTEGTEEGKKEEGKKEEKGAEKSEQPK